MGIRLHCPNGHKLNVKSFLAGKRGICPHCGAKFDIPSDQKESPDSGDELSLPPPAGDFGLPAPSGQLDPGRLDHPTPLSKASGAGFPRPATGAALPEASTGIAPAAQRMFPGGSAIGPATGETSRFGAPSPVVPIPTVPTPAIQQAAPQPSVRDPIAEAPGAVWYVRHPVAGQFGPAPAELFRQWLNEGRITADSLVWREGWIDWQTARSIFPQFAPAPVATPQLPFEPAPAPSDAFGIPEVVPMLPGIKHGGRSRKKTDKTMMIMTLGMLVLLVVLGIIFVIVLNSSRQLSPPPDETSWRPATLEVIIACWPVSVDWLTIVVV